jgi:tRNA (mo5U34)-methyltransferase
MEAVAFARLYGLGEPRCFLDNDPARQGGMCMGLPVVQPTPQSVRGLDRIILATFALRPVRAQLRKLGVPQYRILDGIGTAVAQSGGWERLQPDAAEKLCEDRAEAIRSVPYEPTRWDPGRLERLRDSRWEWSVYRGLARYLRARRETGPVGETLRRRIEPLPWFHAIDLGHGVVTPGRKRPVEIPFRTFQETALYGFPLGCAGKDVLDVGANDGFFSFEAERDGARRVLAVDRWDRSGPPGITFRTARTILRSRVRPKVMDLARVEPATVGRFHITLLLGVLYYLPDPDAALRRLADVTLESILVQSRSSEDRTGSYDPIPRARYLHGSDPKRHWEPNLRCLCEMVRAAGFPRVQIVHPGPPAVVRGWKR